MYENIIKKIHEADTISIFMHINPDGDCIGSSLALYCFLTNMGKTPFVFLEHDNIIKDNLLFLPNIEKINAPSPKHFDLAIAVDCGAANRLGNGAYKIFLKADDFACIDHHESSTPFVETTILESGAASTTQILFKILSELDARAIDKDVATCLFTGLASDSGSLTYSSTTAESFFVAGELVKLGASAYEINKRLYKDTKLNVFNLTNRVLAKAQFFLDNKLGIISFFNEDFAATNTTQDATDGLINKIIDIKDVCIAISLSEINNTAYKVGIRSKNGYNAGELAAIFGGGGHFAASGCRLYCSYDEAISKLLAAASAILGN